MESATAPLLRDTCGLLRDYWYVACTIDELKRKPLGRVVLGEALVLYRDDPACEVVAFTATQIPHIEDRRFPAELAGPRYPNGIPVHPEDELERVIAEEDVQQVVTIWGTQNFGEQVMQGIEFEFDWIPYAGGRLNGWVTLMDTEIKDDYITQWYYGMDAQFGRADYAQSIANVPENAVNLKGNEAPFSPDVALTINFEHTFDLGRVPNGALVVRRAREGESLVTLDGVERPLAAGDGVIADESGTVVSLAGVMGGASTEISEHTTDVLLEMAWWDPPSISRPPPSASVPPESPSLSPQPAERSRVNRARGSSRTRVMGGPPRPP